MPDPRAKLLLVDGLRAEAAVRARVDLDLIGGVQELLARNVGARLAAEHFRLSTSESPIALAAAWRAKT